MDDVEFVFAEDGVGLLLQDLELSPFLLNALAEFLLNELFLLLHLPHKFLFNLLLFSKSVYVFFAGLV